MNSRKTLAVFAAALAALLIVLALATVLLTSEDTSGSRGSGPSEDGAPRQHALSEAPQARFLSIFAVSADGSLASYMVGGQTDEFNAFAAAVAGAPEIVGGSDESFTDLLVFSFGTNDTLEVAYSRAHNQFILEDRLYQPKANLAPMIAAVEEKF